MASAATAAAGAALPARKLRVLMMHGFYQNATIFRMKTAALRKALASVATFDYVQAPHALSNDDEFRNKPADVTPDTYFAWWKLNNATRRYVGWERSVAAVREHVLANGGPYDVYLGFSQGAAFVSLLAALASAQRNGPAGRMAELAARAGEEPVPDMSWFWPRAESAADPSAAPAASPSLSPPLLILVSGFVPRVAHLKQYYPQPLTCSDATSAAAQAAAAAMPSLFQHPSPVSLLDSELPFAHDADLPLIPLPSLHVFGLKDGDVPPTEGDELRRLFLNPQAEVHEGGHVVPSNAHANRRYKQFLAERGGS